MSRQWEQYYTPNTSYDQMFTSNKDDSEPIHRQPTTIEERIKALVKDHYRKDSRWHSVYSLKQLLTRVAGYCYQEELYQWLQDLGFACKYERNIYWVKMCPKGNRNSALHRDTDRFIREYQEKYPEWHDYRELPQGRGQVAKY
jgi:hypothetical protein